MDETELPAGAPRVLHVLREDHATHVGGDLVQLRETVAALRTHGVHAIAATLDEAPSEIDVAHLYNVQLPDALLDSLAAVRRRWPNAAVVVSPILARTTLSAFRTRETRTAAKAGRAIAGDIVRSVRARRAFSSADAVVVNSSGEQAAVRRWFRRRDGIVVPNGIALERWPARGNSPDRERIARRFGLDPSCSVVIACVGRIEPLKNQATLIRAVDRIPHAALLLVGPQGDPPYAATVRSLASARPGTVALTGSLDQADVAATLADVDVHVLPSLRETFGLVTLEAAASGCEVVADRGGWIREWLGGDAGYADMASPASIASAIADVRARPRQPGLRRAVERYDWSVVGRSISDVYARVTARRRSERG
jgi:glycosyltransferase involved in cell wall biosynthesis